MMYLDFPTADSPEEAVRYGVFPWFLSGRRTEKNELELKLFGHGGGGGGGGGRRQCVYRAAKPLTPMRRGLLGAALDAHPWGPKEVGFPTRPLSTSRRK